MFKEFLNWKRLSNRRQLLTKQTRGQGLVEYSLILVLVSVVSVAILSLMGQEVSDALETTVCSLDDGEDCECRVIEKVITSEYSCTAGDLFAYTAATTCGENTELSLLINTSSSSDEYGMSYNPSTSLFEMTDSTSICNDLGASPAPDVFLVSRHTEDDSIHSFRLGADGVPVNGTSGGGDSSSSSSGSGSSGSGSSGSGSSGSGSSGSGSSGSGSSGSGSSGSGSSGSGSSGSGSSGSGSSGSGSSGSGSSGSGSSGSGSSGSGSSGSGSSGSGSSGSGSSGSGDSNNAPVMDAVATQHLDEGASKTVTISATDADDDTLTYSPSGTLPAFITFVDSSSPPTLTIAPGHSDAGTHSVTIEVSDGNGGSDSVTFDVVVNDVNQPPVLASIGDQAVNETETITITLAATDDDGDDLTYGLSGSLPGFITVDSSSGSTVVTISPGYDDAGTYSIEAYVTDPSASSDSETFSVVVSNTNQAPFITSVSAQSVNESETLTVNISASDADVDDTLTLSATGTEDFMTFTPSGDSATLVLAPDSEDSGTYTVTISVSDGTSSYDTTVDITVVDVPVANRVAFIVANASSLGSGDTAVKSRLEGNGYTVDLHNASTGESTVLANSPVLIIISESVSSGDVGSRFRNTAVPALVMERALFDDMKLANTNGSDGGEKRVRVVNDSHAMAAGLSNGNRNFSSSNHTIGYGDPANNNVIMIATIDNNQNRGTIFIYDTGTTMENGVSAPARRVGFFPYATVPAGFNGNGWKLFDAAVTWATG